MSRLHQSTVQFDYFSENFEKFEQDFYKFADINIPLTFLAGDILHYLCSSDRDYFKLNEKNSKDNKEHYFYFKKSYTKENKNIIRFTYLGHQKT